MKRYFCFVIVLGFLLMNGISNGYAQVCTGSCDDSNICTTDTYVAGVCTHTNNSLPCDDTNICMVNDVCFSGGCTGTPINCDDNNACTYDMCIPATGCVHMPTNLNSQCTGTADVVEWLANNQRISNAIVWQDSSAGPLTFSAWPDSRRHALKSAFIKAWYGGSYGLTDPPPNILTLGDNDDLKTVLAEGDAWSLYISYVAHSLALEMGHRVSWSLLDYSDQDLAILLDSQAMFSWDAGYQGYVISNPSQEAMPAPPDFTYSFLINNAMITKDRLTTIANLLDWSRNNMLHFGCFISACYPSCPSSTSALMAEWNWQYRGFPPVSRIIKGTNHEQTGQFGHWTWGCGGTTSFLRAALRAVNIPEIDEFVGGHALAHFTSEGMYLSHGDDPYDLNWRSQPPIPSTALLIDQATWDSWFSPDVPPQQKNYNVGRQPLELAKQYLSDYLLLQYCVDRSTGVSHDNGSVYSLFKNIYSLAELEDENGINLWGRMDAKLLPTITSVTPAIGQVGTYVFVHGTNLCSGQCRKSNSTETVVSLNNVNGYPVNASPIWVQNDFLYFQVPAGATTSSITISTEINVMGQSSCWSNVVSTEVFTIQNGANCTNKNCDDGNACTIDSCDVVTGNCIHTNNTWACDDGNVCTSDSCDPATGNCIHTNNTLPCDDHNACTSGDVCSGGVCSGTPIACDDGNACTINTCNPSTGCVYNRKICNDNNACTIDTCDPATGCVFTQDTTAAVTTASPQGGTYHGAQTVTLTCSDGTGAGCTIYYTTDGSTPTTTSSVYTNPISITARTASTTTLNYFATDLCGNSETPAKTQNYIIINAAPTLGTVTPSAITTASGTPQTFTAVYSDPDGYADLVGAYFFVNSTMDSANNSIYAAYTSNTLYLLNDAGTAFASCKPGDAINLINTQGALNCADTTVSGSGNDLTINWSITPTAAFASTTAKNLYLYAYDTSGFSAGYSDKGDWTIIDCDDGNVCTIDSCNTATGACVYTPVANGTSCADNNLCNGTETCQGGICTAGTPLVCNDNNACTTDTCNPSTGCVYTPVANGTSCADNNVCNGMETCQGGICKAGTPLVCNDNNLCTTDTCDPVKGCVYKPKCDDNNVCTTDTCNTRTGACTHTNNTLACNDNNACTTNDKCSSGVCKGTAKNCSDNNACTTDTCDPATGICGHTAIVCNDNKSCTTDTCNPASGCVYTSVANGTVCSEVSNGRCQTGNCVSIDLLPTAMTATKSGTTGVVVNDTVKNQGTSTAGSFTIKYYLSTDTTYGSGDIVLASASNGTGTCSRTVSSLSAGSSSSSGNKTCYKPSGAVTGVKYYVLVVDDTANTVIEYDESNNNKSTSVQINW